VGTDNLYHTRKAGRKKREEEVRGLRAARWLILCEGKKTEPNYFSAFIKSINNNNKIDVKLCGEGANTESLVKRVEKYFDCCREIGASKRIPYSKIIFIFDKDSFKDEQFNNAIFRAKNTYKNCIVAWSNESFELWLCLHFEYIDAALDRNQYNTRMKNYLNEKYIKNDPEILGKIINSGGSVENALRNAKKLIKNKNLKNPAKANPVTLVYEAIEALISESNSK